VARINQCLVQDLDLQQNDGRRKTGDGGVARGSCLAGLVDLESE